MSVGRDLLTIDLEMALEAAGSKTVDTGLRVAGRNIMGSSDVPRYHLRGGAIRSRRGDTGYFIDGEVIMGPEGDSGFRIEAGRITGPSTTVPWDPHADGSDSRGPGF